MPPELAPDEGLGPMTPIMYRVESRRIDLADTVTLGLAPVDDAIEAPRPGQFNMLWAFGIGEAPISLAGSEDGSLKHTIRGVGAVTESLCASHIGDQIGVRGPFGTGWPQPRAEGGDVLIVAGGLGLAPLRPVVTELLSRRRDYGRAVLLVGARSPENLLYRDELDEWQRHDDLEVAVTVDVATPSWRGDVGLVTRLIDHATFDPVSTTAFLCGPEVMMRFSAQAIVDSGVPETEVVLSLERNMHCAVGHCGHCQLGPLFVCKDGPVLDWSRAQPLLRIPGR